MMTTKYSRTSIIWSSKIWTRSRLANIKFCWWRYYSCCVAGVEWLSGMASLFKTAWRHYSVTATVKHIPQHTRWRWLGQSPQASDHSSVKCVVALSCVHLVGYSLYLLLRYGIVVHNKGIKMKHKFLTIEKKVEIIKSRKWWKCIVSCESVSVIYIAICTE